MKDLEKRVEAMMHLCLAENDEEREVLRQELRRYMRHRLEQNSPEREIRRILLELGAPDHLAGHPYAVRAILLAIEDSTYLRRITFCLYPKLAAEFDTTAARVERAIRHLIEVTWCRGDLDVLDKYFGNTISASRGKPTNGEFIARLANVVLDKMQRAA